MTAQTERNSADESGGKRRAIRASDLRRAMLARGWTQEQLAQESSLDKNTITRALDDRYDLRFETETKILAALSRHPVDDAIVTAIREVAS